MLSAVLRRCAPALTIAVLAACSDSTTTPSASPSGPAGPSTLRPESVPVVNATVRVLAGLDGFHPRSINEFDEVVGSTNTGTPFYWSPGRGLILLSHTGYATAEVASINDRGAMAGTAGGNTPVVWYPLPDGTFRVIQKPAGQNCTVTGFTFDAEIIGTCTAGGVSFGSVFNWHGLPTETSGYQYNAISDDGWIGGATNSGGAATGAIVISPTGQLTALRGHDGAIHKYSAVNAVSVKGRLAGYSTEGSCTQAITWGLFTSTPNTWPTNLMGVCGEANGITPDGYVVGTTGDGVAFLWYEQPGPGLQKLPGLGAAGEHSTAVAISLHHALGTITSNGVTHTIIWNLPDR